MKALVHTTTSFWDFGSLIGRVYSKDRGLVVDDFTYVASQHDSQELLYFGKQAYALWDKSPSHLDVFPLISQGRVRSETDLAQLIEVWKQKISSDSKLFQLEHHRVFVTIPLYLEPIYKSAMIRAFKSQGVEEVIFIPTSFALLASLGNERLGDDVVMIDCGAGKNEVVCFSGGGVLGSTQSFNGGNSLDINLKQYLLATFGVEVEMSHIINLKKSLSLNGGGDNEIKPLQVRNREGKIVTFRPDALDLGDLIQKFAQSLLDTCKSLFDQLPGTSHDKLRKQGVILGGGGGQILGLLQFLDQQLNLPVRLLPRFTHASVLGAMHLESEWEKNKHAQINEHA